MQLEEWVRLEVEKYATSVDKKHHREIDAFVEQMSFKDEKLEEFQWQLLSTKIKSKRLQSILEGLNRDVSQLRHDNTRLEALLLDREEEVSSLKQHFESQLETQSCENPELNSSLHDPGIAYDAVLSKLKVVKKKLVENDKESEKALQNYLLKRRNLSLVIMPKTLFCLSNPKEDVKEDRNVASIIFLLEKNE